MTKRMVRAVVYAPVAARRQWAEKELISEEIVAHVCRGIAEVITTLVDEPAPRPQILVVDFDSLHPAEILELHSIRDRGWTGTIFALGSVPHDLRKSLRIEQVLGRLVDNSLRVAVGDVGFDAQTRRLPIFS